MPVYIPFNHKPYATGTVDSDGIGGGTYAVPAGFYARVVISMVAAVNFKISSSIPGQVTHLNLENACQNHQQELWLKAGDIVTITESYQSGVALTTAVAGLYAKEAESKCSWTKNATEVFELKAKATGSIGQNVAGTLTMDYDSYAHAVLHYEEYPMVV